MCFMVPKYGATDYARAGKTRIEGVLQPLGAVVEIRVSLGALTHHLAVSSRLRSPTSGRGW